MERKRGEVEEDGELLTKAALLRHIFFIQFSLWL